MFTSTRGASPVPLREAVLNGLAPDGGLYVPVDVPTGLLSERVYSSIDVAEIFFPTVPRGALVRVLDRALTFSLPLVEVEPNRHVLELFHGPTHAFKDFGARFMAALMVELGAGATGRRTVLVATSGDTGGAVASAFHEMEGHRVVVLFPREGVSPRQRRQMTTLGGNVLALSVAGTFDDCQGIVKDALGSVMLARKHGLTSANSINVARLLPQVLYYAHASSQLGPECAPHFFIPSGNLGNLCAGLLAARAGVSASGFTAATNANRGFVDFLDGADFQNRASVSTTSSAMDVGTPSNFERIMWLYGGDAEVVRDAIRGVSIDDASVARCITDVFERTGYILDPHTAVAYEAARGHDASPEAPQVVLATAHPAKFPETVEAAIGREVPAPPGLTRTDGQPEYMIDIEAIVESLTSILDGRTA